MTQTEAAQRWDAAKRAARATFDDNRRTYAAQRIADILEAGKPLPTVWTRGDGFAECPACGCDDNEPNVPMGHGVMGAEMVCRDCGQSMRCVDEDGGYGDDGCGMSYGWRVVV